MTDDTSIIDVIESRAKRREERRDFFRQMGGKALMGTAAAMSSSIASAQTAAPTDNDILNLALNLEYLEGQFYSYAAFGRPLPADQLTGTQTQGSVLATGARQVTFADNQIRRYANEIAQDEINHVRFLRSALGSAAVAQPAIDISVSPTSAFSNAARAAGVITGPNSIFDPYANDDFFLLGAFIFEDVGVTAYKGAARLLTNKDILEAAAAILSVEAYHAAIVRTTLYGRGGAAMSMLRQSADRISDARDSLDGTTDLDQGISPVAARALPAGGAFPTASGAVASNIVPLDANGLAFSRTSQQVHNIVYLNRMAVTSGGFFPNGTNNANAALRTSGAN